MKTIICGPPHSGKSVFISNLMRELPTDSTVVIRGCPDGEGIWSNNKNQKVVNLVRKKGEFTPEFVEDTCNAIDNQEDCIIIILVDVGGKISEENEKIFSRCDSYIVISRDEESKLRWKEFADEKGLKCVALLDSKLEGKDEIYSIEPYINGRITGLERGKYKEDKTIIKKIVSEIVSRSNYKEKKKAHADNVIDDTELGFELGYGTEEKTEKGDTIKKVYWKEKAVKEAREAVKEKIKGKDKIKLNGIRASFMATAISKEIKNNGISDIEIYDQRSAQYIPIKNIKQKRNLKKAEGLDYHIIESKKSIFLDVDLTKGKYTLEDYEKIILPKLDKNKSLYISGRLPLWLLTSITNSYDNKEIYTFQPGKGFTCIDSTDRDALGRIKDGIDEINIEQYYEYKKEQASREILPVKAKTSRVANMFRALLQNFKERKDSKKYVDTSIRAHVEMDSSKKENAVKRIVVPEPIQIDNPTKMKTKTEDSPAKTSQKQAEGDPRS